MESFINRVANGKVTAAETKSYHWGEYEMRRRDSVKDKPCCLWARRAQETLIEVCPTYDDQIRTWPLVWHQG